MKQNDLNKIFVKTKFKNNNGMHKDIPNTAQNLYLNNNQKKATQIKQTQIKQTQQNEDSGESDSDNSSESESESESEEDELIQKNDKTIDEITDELVDSADIEPENENETESETETENESETDADIENETTDTKNIASDVIETEYNDDDDKDDIKNDNETEDCLYDYDDINYGQDSDNKIHETLLSDRITDNKLTHYEKVRILGIRAKQIAMGAKVMVKYDTNMSSIDLAKNELNNKTIPLLIKRSLPNNSFEIWKINELSIGDPESNILIDDIHSSFKIDYNFNM